MEFDLTLVTIGLQVRIVGALDGIQKEQTCHVNFFESLFHKNMLGINYDCKLFSTGSIQMGRSNEIKLTRKRRKMQRFLE